MKTRKSKKIYLYANTIKKNINVNFDLKIFFNLEKVMSKNCESEMKNVWELKIKFLTDVSTVTYGHCGNETGNLLCGFVYEGRIESGWCNQSCFWE